MKKYILTAITAVFLQAAYSQETIPALQKGKWMIETNLSPFQENNISGFSFTKNNDQTKWSVGGEAGYFIQDKLALKAGIGIYDYKVQIELGNGYGDFNISQTILNYKIGAKYYAINHIPLQLDINGINKDGKNGLLLGIQGGYALFLNNNIAIEPAVRYDYGLSEITKDSKIFAIRVGFSLFF